MLLTIYHPTILRRQPPSSKPIQDPSVCLPPSQPRSLTPAKCLLVRRSTWELWSASVPRCHVRPLPLLQVPWGENQSQNLYTKQRCQSTHWNKMGCQPWHFKSNSFSTVIFNSERNTPPQFGKDRPMLRRLIQPSILHVDSLLVASDQHQLRVCILYLEYSKLKIRRSATSSKECHCQIFDEWHPLYGHTPSRSRLKYRRSFLNAVNPHAEASSIRNTMWEKRLASLYRKPSMPKHASEDLPPGADASRAVWKCLKRQRSWTGRCKVPLKKLGFLKDDDVSCVCGTEP